MIKDKNQMLGSALGARYAAEFAHLRVGSREKPKSQTVVVVGLFASFYPLLCLVALLCVVSAFILANVRPKQ